MQIQKCDRCGKIIPDGYPFLPKVSQYSIYGMDRVFTARKIDLCNDCEQEFTKWLNMMQEVSNAK